MSSAVLAQSFVYTFLFLFKWQSKTQQPQVYHPESSYSTSNTLLPAPEHFAHVHRRLFQYHVTYMGVDDRRSLAVRVAYDLHRDQRVDARFVQNRWGLACKQNPF